MINSLKNIWKKIKSLYITEDINTDKKVTIRIRTNEKCCGTCNCSYIMNAFGKNTCYCYIYNCVTKTYNKCNIKIIEPKAEYWEQTDMYEHIANIASVCYHSPKKTGEQAKQMVEKLIKNNHISATRHCSMYFVLYPNTSSEDYNIVTKLKYYNKSPFIDYIILDNAVYVATNYNFLLYNKDFYEDIKDNQVSPQEFIKLCPQLMRFTFCLTTQISTSRELNRKSPNCIMEESTRYIKIGEKVEPTIVRPHWISEKDVFLWNNGNLNSISYDNENVIDYILDCNTSFNNYERLIKRGIKQEDARGVLPLDTKTTVIYTYSVKEWSDIFKLRYLDKTGKAHNNCKIIMKFILDEFNKIGYKINNYGDIKYVGK